MTRRYFRKKLLLPAEHGSWSWLLVPFFAGAFVAGEMNGPAWLALLGGLAAFLLRQPAIAWLRIRGGRGRAADGSLALGWTVALGSVSLACLLLLLLLGRGVLLWLLLPVLLLLLIYVLAANFRRAATRSLWMEVAGAAGLATTAPAAYMAVSGQVDRLAWILWILLATQNILGVLYVRLRIADTHARLVNRSHTLLGHSAGLLLVAALTVAGTVPWPALLPYGAFTLRAAWAARRPRPVDNVKRFGFTEVGVEILSGAWIVLAFGLM